MISASSLFPFSSFQRNSPIPISSKPQDWDWNSKYSFGQLSHKSMLAEPQHWGIIISFVHRRAGSGSKLWRYYFCKKKIIRTNFVGAQWACPRPKERRIAFCTGRWQTVAEILEMGVNPNCLVMVLGPETVEITRVQLAHVWLISDGTVSLLMLSAWFITIVPDGASSITIGWCQRCISVSWKILGWEDSEISPWLATFG